MERTGFSAPTVPSTERTVTTSGPSEYQAPPEKKATVAVACAANGSTERIAVAAANAAPRPMETQYESRSQRSNGSAVSVRLLAARTLLRRKQAAAKVDQTAAQLDVEAAEIDLEIAKSQVWCQRRRFRRTDPGAAPLERTVARTHPGKDESIHASRRSIIRGLRATSCKWGSR